MALSEHPLMPKLRIVVASLVLGLPSTFWIGFLVLGLVKSFGAVLLGLAVLVSVAVVTGELVPFPPGIRKSLWMLAWVLHLASIVVVRSNGDTSPGVIVD